MKLCNSCRNHKLIACSAKITLGSCMTVVLCYEYVNLSPLQQSKLRGGSQLSLPRRAHWVRSLMGRCRRPKGGLLEGAGFSERRYNFGHVQGPSPSCGFPRGTPSWQGSPPPAGWRLKRQNHNEKTMVEAQLPSERNQLVLKCGHLCDKLLSILDDSKLQTLGVQEKVDERK